MKAESDVFADNIKPEGGEQFSALRLIDVSERG